MKASPSLSCLPESKTGKTVFSFALIPQLKIYKAEKLGELDPALALELYEFAKIVRVMNGKDRRMVLEALKRFSGSGDDGRWELRFSKDQR